MKPITKLLVANRGEIALRIFRTAQRMGLHTVAVYSDADAQALHVQAASLAVPLHGNASADTYLRIDKILQAAHASGADAVHPGYGFLSENADFAQAVIDAGLVWVGPPPAAIRSLGSKSAAKALALARGVPCLPGYYGADQSDERLVQEAQRLGWPLMVKAAAGGGGRGMRLVTQAEQFLGAVHSARSEALSAFGSGELLLERALLNPRHVEVQVFADAHGHCIHLGERDCSVQRRHQKIIEESPSPAVDASLRERMGRCATELALAAGYVGAGTVEFLLEEAELSDAGPPQGARAPSGGSEPHAVGSVGANYFLMEMNTRLQVEHPVTEMRTGLDLVEWQLRVARGEPLPLTQEQVQFAGHAIEVRLCAEDENFNPHTGTVRHFKAPAVVPFKALGGVRFDHALALGQEVSPHYDSMLGKLIAHAPTREEALQKLATALDCTELLGLPSNRAFLAACLRHEVFQAGQARIAFLAEQGDAIRSVLQNKEQTIAHSRWLAAILAANSGLNAAPSSLACPFTRPARLRHRGKLFDAPLGGAHLQDLGNALAAPTGATAVRLEGTECTRWHVHHAGVDAFVDDASFEPPAGQGHGAAADAVRAPFNGKLIAVKVQVGASVLRGDALLTIESMKLEHSLSAPRDGVVAALHAEPGQQVGPGQLLLTLEALP